MATIQYCNGLIRYVHVFVLDHPHTCSQSRSPQTVLSCAQRNAHRSEIHTASVGEKVSSFEFGNAATCILCSGLQYKADGACGDINSDPHLVTGSLTRMMAVITYVRAVREKRKRRLCGAEYRCWEVVMEEEGSCSVRCSNPTT